MRCTNRRSRSSFFRRRVSSSTPSSSPPLAAVSDTTTLGHCPTCSPLPLTPPLPSSLHHSGAVIRGFKCNEPDPIHGALTRTDPMESHPLRPRAYGCAGFVSNVTSSPLALLSNVTSSPRWTDTARTQLLDRACQRDFGGYTSPQRPPLRVYRTALYFHLRPLRRHLHALLLRRHISPTPVLLAPPPPPPLPCSLPLAPLSPPRSLQKLPPPKLLRCMDFPPRRPRSPATFRVRVCP
jgi:hypothetical protein